MLHIRVRRQAADLLGDIDIALLQAVLHRPDTGSRFVRLDVYNSVNGFRARSVELIAERAQIGVFSRSDSRLDFLPEVFKFNAVFILVHTQDHGGPVVGRVQRDGINRCGAGGIRLEAGHLNQCSGWHSRTVRSSRDRLGALVQLNRDAVRTQVVLIILIVPDLQHTQAVMFGVVGIGNGSLGVRSGILHSRITGCIRGVFQYNALDGIAGQTSLIFHPGVDLLHAVNVSRQIINGGGKERILNKLGILIARLCAGLDLLCAAVLQRDFDAGLHVVGIQLHGHAGRPLAVLVAFIVPDLHDLRDGLFGRVAVGDGPFAVRIAFTINVRCNIHSVGRTVEGDGAVGRTLFLHGIGDRRKRGSDVFNRRQVSKRIGPLVGRAENSFRNRAFGYADCLPQFHGNGIRPFTVIVVIVVPDLLDRDLSRNVGVGDRNFTLCGCPFRCAGQIIGIIRTVFHLDAGNLQVSIILSLCSLYAVLVIPVNRHGHCLGRRVIHHARGCAAGFGNGVDKGSGLSKGNRIEYLRFAALHGNCADCLSIRISQRDGKGLVSGICTGDNLLHRDLSSHVAVYQLGEEDQLDAILFSGLRRLGFTDDILVGVSGSSAVSLLTRDDDRLTGRVSGTAGSVGFHPAVAVAVSACVFLIHANGHSGPVISLGQLDDLMSSSIGIR